jgi:hypothetical protein
MSWRSWGLVAGLVLGLATLASAQVEGQAVKGFRLPEYDEEGKLKQQLYGETATFLQDGIIQLTGLKIEIFSRGLVTARIYSPACAYDPDRKRAASKEHIRIVTGKGVVTGEGFAWNGENQQFQIFKNARVTLEGQVNESLVAPKPAHAAEPTPEPAETEE